MEEALRALNRLVSDGVIETYAIGGAVGASFYIEPLQTEDIDAFVFLPKAAGGLLDLSPIYDALKAQGGVMEREYVRFGGWPLQILPDSTPLVAEAIRTAMETDFEGIPTKVFLPEYLCCIALQTGRAKDYLRVAMFLEDEKVDAAALGALATRYELQARLSKVETERDGAR
jgi:hypothetical protein